jgi:uncharacterized coiled-coil protein SlyX
MTETREGLLARIQELEDQNAELTETLERINDLSAEAIEDTDAEESD